MTTVNDVLARYRKWMHLPDPLPLYVVLATVAANHVEQGDPVWLLLVGPPGAGKTETLNATRGLPYVHEAATLTEASLLSGTPKKERAEGSKGGLLRSIGDFGIIQLKDFTSLLSMNRDSRSQVLAALREIYDGAWTRHVGTSGGMALSWEGKVGLVGGCTGTIDQHHAVIGVMGERFLLYRLPPVDPAALARRSLDHAGQAGHMRAELAEVVTDLFETRTMLKLPPRDLDDDETTRLVNLATVVARCRSAVARDSRNAEVELIPEPEAPGRLVNQLRLVWHGLEAIGVDEYEANRALVTVAVSSMPALRRHTIDHLLAFDQPLATGAVAESLGYPTSTMRRTLEDLTAHHVIERHRGGEGRADTWSATDWLRLRWPTVPENPQPLITLPLSMEGITGKVPLEVAAQ